MSTHKHIDIICILITVFAVCLTALFMNGEAFGITKIVDEDAEGYEGTEYFTGNDLNADWDDSDATHITLDGADVTIRGTGAYVLDGNAVISNGGYYVVSGTLADGALIVDAFSSSKVWIRLDGVDITCTDDAALRVEQADKVFLTLAEGTQNSLTSGSFYSDAAIAENRGGAVFARDDLTVNGSGSLTITSSYKHGMDCNDSLHITGGDITVNVPEDGFHVNDSLRITDCNLVVYAGDDGLQCDTEIVVAGGDILIVNETGRNPYGLNTKGETILTGGTIRISDSGDGSESVVLYSFDENTNDDD